VHDLVVVVDEDDGRRVEVEQRAPAEFGQRQLARGGRRADRPFRRLVSSARSGPTRR
jgi:hypothetical protein